MQIFTILPSLEDFTHQNQGSNQQCHYSDIVKRDFLRAFTILKFFHPCDIYTLNKCEDKAQYSTTLNINEINVNISHTDFTPLLKGKGWNLDILYLNHYWMPNTHDYYSFAK